MSREGYKNSSRISRRRSWLAHRFINFSVPLIRWAERKPNCLLLHVFLRFHAFEVGLLVAANLFFPQPFHSESEGVADVHAMCRDLGCYEVQAFAAHLNLVISERSICAKLEENA